MDFRKNEKSNLEDKKGMFFLVGLLFILSVSYAVVNLKSYAKSAYNFEMSVDDSFEELPPITTPPPPELTPPPPPPAAKPITPEIELVEDEVITEEPDFDDTSLEDVEIEDVPLSDGPDEVLDDTPLMVVQNPAHFPECAQLSSSEEKRKCTNKLFVQYFAEEFDMPELAKEMGYNGKVYLQFIVNTQGKVTDVKVLKGLTEIVDKEAVRAAFALPKLIPGRDLDRPRSQIFTLPIEITNE